LTGLKLSKRSLHPAVEAERGVEKPGLPGFFFGLTQLDKHAEIAAYEQETSPIR
jgi:hypothetical protein